MFVIKVKDMEKEVWADEIVGDLNKDKFIVAECKKKDGSEYTRTISTDSILAISEVEVPNRTYSMIVVFTGTLGSGKTLSMSAIGTYMSRKSGLRLYSNYGLQNSERIYTVEQLLEAKSGILCFDEAHTSIDSRLYKDNVTFTHFLLHTRKKGLIVLMTTQVFGQVDIRARGITDYLIMCSKKGDGIWLQFIDWQDRIIKHKVNIPDYKRYYSIYDTYELVNPITAKKPETAHQSGSRGTRKQNAYFSSSKTTLSQSKTTN